MRSLSKASSSATTCLCMPWSSGTPTKTAVDDPAGKPQNDGHVAGVFDGHLHHFGGDSVLALRVRCGPRRLGVHVDDCVRGPFGDGAHRPRRGGNRHQPKGRRRRSVLHDFQVVRPEHRGRHWTRAVLVASDQRGLLRHCIHGGLPRFAALGRRGPRRGHRPHVGQPRGDGIAHGAHGGQRGQPRGEGPVHRGRALVLGVGLVLSGQRSRKPQPESSGDHS